MPQDPRCTTHPREVPPRPPSHKRTPPFNATTTRERTAQLRNRIITRDAKAFRRGLEKTARVLGSDCARLTRRHHRNDPRTQVTETDTNGGLKHYGQPVSGHSRPFFRSPAENGGWNRRAGESSSGIEWTSPLPRQRGGDERTEAFDAHNAVHRGSPSSRRWIDRTDRRSVHHEPHPSAMTNRGGRPGDSWSLAKQNRRDTGSSASRRFCFAERSWVGGPEPASSGGGRVCIRPAGRKGYT
jgi:hypothetical protein